MSGKVTIMRKTKGKGVQGLKDNTNPAATKVGFNKGLGKYPGQNVSIFEVAMFNEFGTEDMPERPFLRVTVKENRQEYLSIIKNLLNAMLWGKMPADTAIKALGLKAVADIKNKIDTLSEPPNADLTVDIKGFDNPLVHTGLMKQSVNFEVQK